MAQVIPIGFASFAVAIKHSRDDEAYFVTFGTQADLAEASAVDHTNHAMSSFAAPFASRFDSEIFVTHAIGRFGVDGPDPLIVQSDLAPIGGSRSASSVPPNTAVLIQKRSGIGGRKNRGRMYVPMAATAGAETEGGVLQAGERTALQTAASTFLVNLSNGQPPDVPTMAMVILHNADPGIGGTPPPTPVTSLNVDSVLATQRRRLRR